VPRREAIIIMRPIIILDDGTTMIDRDEFDPGRRRPPGRLLTSTP